MGSMRASEWQEIRWNHVSWRQDTEGLFVRIYLPTEKSLLYRKMKNVDIVDAEALKAVQYLWLWWKCLASWKEWLNMHGNDRVFGTATGKRLRSSHTRPYFNLYAVLNGCEPSNVTCHSLRIGATSELAQKNACDRLIQASGRWNSDAFRTYVRPDYAALRSNRRKFFSN